MPIFRKAEEKDIDIIEQIYSDVISCEEKGLSEIGWIRGVYPTRQTAEDALFRGDLFVMEDGGAVVGSAVINKRQVEEYKDGTWQYSASDSEVMVLHTLVISPSVAGRGYGKAFVDFYEKYALSNGCPYLRMDTNERNVRARAMYKKLGYSEIGIVPCDFNGIKGIGLVLLEKKLV